jgi:hypothetical protein
MKFVVYRESQRREDWRLEYDMECPDAVAQEILRGDHPEYADLFEWAEDQPGFSIYGTPDREISEGVRFDDGDTGWALEATSDD